MLSRVLRKLGEEDLIAPVSDVKKGGLTKKTALLEGQSQWEGGYDEVVSIQCHKMVLCPSGRLLTSTGC